MIGTVPTWAQERSVKARSWPAGVEAARSARFGGSISSGNRAPATVFAFILLSTVIQFTKDIASCGVRIG
jgi:hypothetical protein